MVVGMANITSTHDRLGISGLKSGSLSPVKAANPAVRPQILESLF
jgi:hypothetical protein